MLEHSKLIVLWRTRPLEPAGSGDGGGGGVGDRWRAVETDARGHLQAGGAGSEDELNRQPTFVSFKSAAQRFAQSKGDLETLCGRQIFNLSGPPLGGTT